MRPGFGDLEVFDCQRLTCLVHNSGSHFASLLRDRLAWYGVEQITYGGVLQRG
jgi:hypothetical protein